MISFDLLPSFYALSENYGAYEEDYLTIYEQGRLTMEARRVYEALLDYGILDTIALRQKTHLSSPSSESRFNKAISDLQSLFMILPVGVTEAGAWRYAFAYDITARHYPDLPDLAHQVSENAARRQILQAFSRSMGAFEMRDPIRLLGWKLEEVSKAVNYLIERGELSKSTSVAGVEGDWYIDKSLLETCTVL